MIENLTQIMGFLDAGFEVCGLCWGGDRKYISTLVYAYILMYYIKDRGFRGGDYLKAEGEGVFGGCPFSY